MKTIPKDKPRVVPVSDPDEIASIERNGKGDIIGGANRIWREYWAYAHSLERWRKRSREKGNEAQP